MGLVLYRNMSSEEWDNLEKGQTPILPSKDGNKEESMVADYFKRHNLPHPKRFVSIAFTVASRDIGEAMWAYGSIRVFLGSVDKSIRFSWTRRLCWSIFL